MTDDELLVQLHWEGQDPDFNDGEGPNGWFGWSLSRENGLDILTVEFEDVDGPVSKASFILTRLD